MKHVSKTTLKKRIAEHRCIFCGCSKQNIVNYHCEYPERAIYYYCNHCGKLLEWTDNSPYYNIWDELKHVKNLTIENIKRIYNLWVP